MPPALDDTQHGLPARGRRDELADLFMTLQRTADRLMQGLEDVLRHSGITPVQYLVLRSLREAGAAGMPSNRIARNMTTHDPDMTRLLDKLEERGVVQRWRDKDDRRVYRVRLTREGAVLLRNVSVTTRELHRKQFNAIDRPKVRALVRLLEGVNAAPIPKSRLVREREAPVRDTQSRESQSRDGHNRDSHARD